jgi:hypothetical protein
VSLRGAPHLKSSHKSHFCLITRSHPLAQDRFGARVARCGVDSVSVKWVQELDSSVTFKVALLLSTYSDDCTKIENNQWLIE